MMSIDWKVGQKTDNGIRKGAERAVMVGLIQSPFTEAQIDEYLDELEFLAMTAGAITIKRFKQKMRHPDVRTFVGKGKLEEIEAYVESHDIDLIIFDDDLSGKQQNLLEKTLKRKIIDRSTLILDIFAHRAQTAQAKTQVELAQMQYILPRLRGMWTHLERQRGGIGMRGPGEKEIETDRRIVRDKIALLKKKLQKIDQQNITQRRNRGDLIRVALVGYTNAGKSTLMNMLSKSDVFAENKLFATLDTTVRKVVLGRMPFLLSDTVGFIRKLPHHLIESFKSTLDETRESDLLIHVIDFSHPHFQDHIATVNKTLAELEVHDKRMLMIFNKMDLYRDNYFDKLLNQKEVDDIESELKASIRKQFDPPCLFISATQKEGFDKLRNTLSKAIKKLYEIRYPYQIKSF
jgi:GTP-binding protein HflX